MPQRDATGVVRTYCEAWLANDSMAVLALYHDDLELEWPGRHRLAGHHTGQAAAIDALLDLQAVTNRRPVEIIDFLVGEHGIVVLVRERWTTDREDVDATSIELVRALDYTVADGRLRACRIFESDQHAVDQWIARYGDVSEG